MSRSFAGQQAVVPDSAPWPFDLTEVTPGEGEAQFSLHVARGAVVRVGVDGAPPPAVASLGLKTLARWRFDPSVSTIVDTIVRHRLDGDMGCAGEDLNQKITARLPQFIEVVSRRLIKICDPVLESVQLHEAVSRLTGRLFCRCDSKAPLSAVELRVFREGQRPTGPARTIHSDADGHYAVHGLGPGAYRLEIRHAGFQIRDYRFVVAADGRDDPFDIELSPSELARPAAVVESGSIPSYPPDARAKRIQGTVSLRVSLRGPKIVDVDATSENAALAAAATANVRTWAFRSANVPVLKIQFVYLLDEAGCGESSSPTVTMRLPDFVSVRATPPCRLTTGGPSR